MAMTATVSRWQSLSGVKIKASEMLAVSINHDANGCLMVLVEGALLVACEALMELGPSQGI